MNPIVIDIRLRRDAIAGDAKAVKTTVADLSRTLSELKGNVALQLSPGTLKQLQSQAQQAASQLSRSTQPIKIPAKLDFQGGESGSAGTFSGGPGAGAGGGGFGFAQGIGRMATMGFAIREGLRLAQEHSAFEDKQQEEGGNPLKQLQDQIEYRKQLQGSALGLGHIGVFAGDLFKGNVTADRKGFHNSTDEDLQQALQEAEASRKESMAASARTKIRIAAAEKARELDAQASELVSDGSQSKLLKIAEERRKFEMEYAKLVSAAGGEMPELVQQKNAFNRLQAAQISKTNIDDLREFNEIGRQSHVADIRASGDTRLADALEHDKQLDDRESQLRKRNPQLADRFRDELKPKLQEEFRKQQDAQELLEKTQLAGKLKDIRATAAEEAMRLEGRAYEAGLAAFKRGIDDRIASLEALAQAETNTAKAAQYRAQAEAEKTARPDRIRARVNEHIYEMDKEGRTIDAATNAADFRADGNNRAASDEEFDARWDEKIAEAKRKGDPNLRKLEAQRQAEFRNKEREKIDEDNDTRLDTLRSNAAAAGKGAVGEEESIREEIIKRQRAAGTDPMQQKLARDFGQARLAEFIRSMAGGYQTFSGADIASAAQRSLIDSNGAADAIKKAQQDAGMLGNPGGNLMSDLPKAGKDMQDAAAKLGKVADKILAGGIVGIIGN